MNKNMLKQEEKSMWQDCEFFKIPIIKAATKQYEVFGP